MYSNRQSHTGCVYIELETRRQWRAATFEYSGSALHAAIVLPLQADFTANRTATKEAAGLESLKRLEENKGGRERGGGGRRRGEGWVGRIEGRLWKRASLNFFSS